MAERYPEAELVLDDELVFDDAPRRSMLRRSEDRPEQIVQEGEVLAGKYRVERVPGRSGLGVVVQVRHMELAQEVTLKFLVPDACAYPEFVQRFVREARAAVKIQGEHVARVTDVGRLESGAPYMVREFLRGPDLAEVVKVRGRLPIEEAVDYVIQACEGVAEGHALGVVHRNLKPTSLVVTRRSDGTALVKVFDFAAAESLHVDPFTERSVQLVGTSAIMASLPYLSPEQIRDPHDVDVRADVYSLGAVLFELLCGQPVYYAETAPALLAMVAADAAPPLRTFIPDVPSELDHLVLRCLSKNRAIRYSSVAELALALRPFASEESNSSIDRIVRLARISKRPELSGTRPPSVPAPAAAPAPSSPVSTPAPAAAPSSPFATAPSLVPGRARGPHGTVIVHGGTSARPLASEPSHDDVTTINPFAAGYPAPAVIVPSAPTPSSPAPAPASRAPAPLRTPVPPPLRSAVPPPLHLSETAPLPLVAPLPRSASPASAAPMAMDPRSMAPAPRMSGSLPPRSSMPSMSRSWAVADEPTAPLWTKNRMVGAGVVAACALLGGVFAVGRASRAPVVAAAAPKPPAAVVPPPAPAPAPPPAPVAPDASAAALAAPAAPTPAALPAAAAPAPVAAAPAPAPAAPPAPVIAAARVAPAPAAAPRPAVQAAVRRTAKPKAESESEVQTVAQKTPRPAAGGDLFDDPR